MALSISVRISGEERPKQGEMVYEGADCVGLRKMKMTMIAPAFRYGRDNNQSMKQCKHLEEAIRLHVFTQFHQSIIYSYSCMEGGKGRSTRDATTRSKPRSRFTIHPRQTVTWPEMMHSTLFRRP